MEERIRPYLLAFFLLFTLSSKGQDLYWVGGSGDWNEPSNWSLNSGGDGGAGIPGDSTDVLFDGASFSGPGATVRINGQATCRDLNFEDPGWRDIYISGPESSGLTVHGDLELQGIAGLKVGQLRFISDHSRTVRSHGGLLRADLLFQGKGSWKVEQELQTLRSDSIRLLQGTLELNSSNVRTGTFITEGPLDRKLKLGKNSELEIHEGIELLDTASFEFLPNGGQVLIDENISAHRVRLNGMDRMIQTARDNGSTTCNMAGCINEIKIIPQDTAAKNGYDLSCPDSCDGKFIARITDSSGCASNASFSYDWTISGSFQKNDSLVWNVCNQANIEVQVTNNNTGQFCQVGYSLEVPFKLKKFTDSKTQPSCPGACDGEISYLPTDGVTPYHYQWDNGDTTQTADSLCQGNDHSLLVTDDNGCKLRDTLSLSDPPAITPNLNTTDASCFGVCDGEAGVNPTGGNGGPYDYSWSTGSTSDSVNGLCAGNYSVTIYDTDSCQRTVNFTIDEPAALQIALDSLDHLVCHDQCQGSISVTVSQGTAPYSYEWYDASSGNPISPQQDTSKPTGLCAGDYYVIVTDANGCKDTSSTFTLTQPTPLRSDSSSTDVLCNGDCNGTATLDTVYGGTPPYTYDWYDAGTGSSIGQTDSTATGLCAGNYYAEINDANGCQLLSDTMEVNEPPALSLDTAKEDILCHGQCTGEASVSVSGGTAPYSIEWFDDTTDNSLGITNDTASGLCQGDYYAVITDANGCVDTTVVITIQQPTELTMSTSSDDITCNGACDGLATTDVNGGVTPYNIDWYDASTGNPIGQSGDTANSLCPGDYYAIVQDANGCTDTTDTVSVVEPAPLSVSLNVTHISCGGACDGSITANVSGGTTPYSYQWYDASTGNPIGNGQTISSLCPGDYYVEVTDGQGCSITSADSTVTEPAPLSLSTNSQQATCNDTCDGMAIANVSGGTPPYTYNWTDGGGNSIPTNDDTLTGLCDGTYNVSIVDDNGCTIGPQNVNVSEPPALDPTLSTTDPSCSGDCDGQASVSMSGGTPGYTYSWSNGGSGSSQSGLCAGSHWVTITDANGCDSTVNFTLNAPSALTLNVTTDSVSCNGDCDGSANVSISGGTTPYDIQWLDAGGNPIPGETNDTITGLCPGNYGVEVIDDNGCSDTAALSIGEPAPLSSSLAVSNITCNGDCDGSITANVSGGNPPFSYQWFDGSGFPLSTGQTINNLCPGDYYVEITDDEGCTYTSNTVTVTQPPALSLNTNGEDISCYGACDGLAVANVSGGTPPYDYNWTDSGGNTLANNDSISNLCEDSYTVNVVDDNGCTIGPQTVTIDEPDSLEATLNKSDATCNGTCNGSAELIVNGGTYPYTYNWSNGTSDSTESGLCAGAYSVTVTDANGCDTTISFNINDPAPLSISTSSSDPTCQGVCDGSGSISISGGTTPYDIQWSDGSGNPIPGDTTTTVSGYCEGTFYVEVTDSNSCSALDSIVLDAPQPINLTVDSAHDASCGSVCDGEAWISVSGGSTPYTYNWIDATSGNPTGITKEDPDSLCSGNYVVEVTDDNGCTALSDTITINESVVITGTPGNKDASCAGYCDGSAWVTPSGGTSPYNYTWVNTTTGDTIGVSDSITGLCSGSYAVTITDDIGCSSAPIMVTVDDAPLLTLSTDSTPVSCGGGNDGTAIVTPSGGTPGYDFQWGAGTGNQTDSIANNLSAGTYSVTVTDTLGCTEDTSVTVTEPTPVVAGLSIEDASCNGTCDGLAYVNPSGGTVSTSYDIQWYDNTGAPIAGANDDSLDAVCAGSYSVTVTDDNGCKDSVSFTIGEPSDLSVNIGNKNDLSCNGSDDGTATTSVSGGTSPYSYQWDDPANQTGATATNLAPGTYTVVVTDDNGCIDSAQVSIGEPAPLSFDTTVTDASCAGECDGEATVTTINGGTAPYSIQWNDPLGQTGSTAVGLCPGTYTVTITDANGCDTSGTVTIEDPTPISLSVNAVNNPTCAGTCDGSIDIAVNGGTPGYSYDWKDAVTGNTVSTAQDPSSLCEGNYELTITDANGCEKDTSFSLNDPAAMSATFTTQNASCGSCDGWAKIDVSNASAPLSYSWSPAPGGGAGTDSIYDLCPGVYTVDVSDADGCTRQFSVSISNVNGEEVETDSTLTSCENTCDGTATATLPGGCDQPTCSISWLDSTGSPIGQSTMTATGLCEGTYYAEVTNGMGCVTVEPVEINSPGKISPNLSVSDATCGGTCNGEGSVTPSGGTAPYSYSWSSGSSPNDSMTTGLCAGSHSVTITDANGCDTTVSFTIGEPPALVIDSKDSSATTCNGSSDGSATVFPSGGTPGYTYEWYDCASGSPIGQTGQQASGLSAGSYYAVVTDNNGCTVSSSCITVNEPAPIVADASAIQHVNCNGSANGIAEVTVSGGAAPYSYEWRDDNGNVVGTGNDTIINLPAGTYAAEVTDANGCQDIDSVTIDEPAPLTASSSMTPASCNGDCDGEIQVTASGGVIPYSYQWYDENGNLIPGKTNPNLTSCPGSYTVEIEDGNGCSTTLTDTITEPGPLNLSMSSSDVTCNGDCDGSATVSVSGGNGGPFTYQWLDSLQNPIPGETSNSINNACAGTYYAVVNDQAGCEDSIQVTIDEPDSLLAITSSNNSTCGDCNGSASVTGTGGVSPYSYQWSPSAGNQTGQVATGLCAGTHSVDVTDANGCTSTFSVSISDQGGEDVDSDSLDVSCYGACDGEAIVNYSCSTTPCNVEWYDASTGNPIGQTGDTASGLCEGSYYAEVTNGNGCVTVKTVQVEGPAPIQANETVNDPSCNGACDGSISLSPSGGSSPYTFTWTDNSGNVIGSGSSINSLCAGTYHVDITGASGCDTSYSYTLDDPAPLTATLDSSNVQCNGDCDGSAAITPSGGTTPYSYQWFDGGVAIPGATDSMVNSLCAGNYSVELTDASGCDTIIDVVIEEPTAIQPDLTHEDVLCNGDCDGSASVDPSGGSGSYSYQWYNGSGVAIPGETDSLISGLCPGDYSISIVDGNGCSVSDTATIDQPAPLTLDFDSIAHPSCNGTCDGMISVTATGGSVGAAGYSYQWYDGAGNPIPNSDTTYKNNLCGGSYTVEAMDNSGCTITADTILIEPAPITTNLATTDPDCGSSNGSASVSGTSGGNAPYSYQWYDNGMNPVGSGPSISGLSAGIYNLEISDDAGCTHTINFTLSDVNAPVVTTDSIEPVNCAGNDDGAIYVSVSGGATPYSYTWNPNGATSQDLTNEAAGIYTLEVVDDSGCTVFHEDTIPGASPITASFDTTHATCGDCDGEAVVNVSGGNTPYSYQWNNGSTIDTASGLCAGVHSVQVTDSSGCQESFDVPISDLGGPNIDNVTENPVTCYGDCDGSGSVSVSGGVPPYEYHWVHDGTDSSWHGNLCGGTYYVQVEDSLGCKTTATVNIPEPAPMEDSVNIFHTACGSCNGTIDLHIDGGTAPYSYNWSNGSTSSTITNLCEGTYSVTVEDDNGCTQSFSYSVSGTNAPVVSASSKDEVCAGQCDGEAYATVTGSNTVVFEWLDASGNPIGQSNDTATGLCPGQYTVEVEDTTNGCLSYATVEIEPADSLRFNLPNSSPVSCPGVCDGQATVSFTGGTYPYSIQWNPSGASGTQASGLCAGTQTVEVTDANGCVDSQQVTIDAPTPIMVNVDSTQEPQCWNSGTGGIWISVTGGSTPYSYDWSGPGGFSSSNQDIGSLNSGTYILEVEDDRGCSTQDTVLIDPTISVTADAGPDTNVCPGDSLILVGSGGITDSEWLDPSGGQVSDGDSLSVVINGAGSFYHVAYNAPCSDTDTVAIGLKSTPTVDAGDDATIIVDEEHQLGGSPTGPSGSSYSWDPYDWFIEDSTAADPTIKPEEAGSYTYVVTVTAPSGCTGMDSVSIEVRPDLDFPDGFSPNGDGVNDVWEIDRIDEFPNATVDVFNRWGERLFHSKGYEEPWDGTYNGEPVPVGTYYYVIDLNDPEAVKQKYTGPITIIR